ncbi:hypothetical protein GCM10022267_91000 [Lentzea roselyniae]|uniref:Uncharacterized protein n=1 Tax=Lentzea roselyniae TaxID=531940 RepID=A0ABP7CGP6_9PSEU
MPPQQRCGYHSPDAGQPSAQPAAASQKFAFRRLVRTFKGGAPESLVDPLVTTRWRRLRDLRCHAPVSIILTGMILWAWIEPLLPVVPRRADHPGRKRLDDRKVSCGILFVLYTDIP